MTLDLGTERRTAKDVCEQRHILEQRHTDFQTIQNVRQENTYNLIYTDEILENTHHTNEYIWVDSDGKGGWKVPGGKGKRLINPFTVEFSQGIKNKIDYIYFKILF